MSSVPAGTSGARGALEGLRSLLHAERGLLAAALAPAPAARAEAFGPLAAAGDRSASDPHEYELLVESVFEGYLLHYSQGRVVVPADEDLRLLAGDHLYALGLARLARLGDLEAVEELADLISLCAHLHARAPDDEAQPWSGTGSLWSLAALAIGGGAWPEQQEAKRLARESPGAPDVAELALAAARERAAKLGLTQRLDRALIAFDEAVLRPVSTT